MNDPWQILILDRHTATEKDVKAAYARLLKQHRPDSDPEGFRRVREAYEGALAWLRNRIDHSPPEAFYADAGPSSDSADPGDHGAGNNRPDLPVVFEDLPLPADAQEALAGVETAAQTGNVEQLEAALMTFHDCCEAGAVSGMSRATALERAFQGRVDGLADAVPDNFLVRMAELGQTGLPHLIVSAWQEGDARERLVQFSRELLENARVLATPDGAILLARVGVLTGLEQPEMAAALANAAYPHLPVDARQHLMAQLEEEAALGKIFAEVSPLMRSFWFQRVRQGGEGYDWNNPEARKALNDAIDRNRYMWEGWGIVKHLMPEKNWALVEHRLRGQAQEAANSQPRSSGFPGWTVAVVVLVIMNMLRFMATDKPPMTSQELSSLRERIQAQKRDTSGSQTSAPVFPVPQKERSTDWTHDISVEDILSGKKLSPQKSAGEETLAPRSSPPPALPPHGGASQRLQDLLNKGALQDGILRQPLPTSSSPVSPAP